VLPAAGAWVDLPTYAFERQPYWLPPGPGRAVTSSGLTGAGHPLLGVVVRLPSGGLLATAQWSAATHPWLAGSGGVDDGALSLLVPEAALVETAIRLGDEVGTPVLAELTVERPVSLPERGSRGLQVLVGEQDGAGQRSIEVFSQSPDLAPDQTWIRHAHGTLAPPSPVIPGPMAPDSAVIEVSLDDAALGDAHRYGLHPGLLEAAVRTAVPDGLRASRWTGVRLLASSASALLVRSTRSTDRATGGQRIGLQLSDPDGQPVMTVEGIGTETLLVEPMDVLGDARAENLFTVEWFGHPSASAGLLTPADSPAPDLVVHPVDTSAGDPRASVSAVLAVLQDFVAQPEPESGRLVVVTPDSGGIAAAAVWGLVRSAQSEHPGRIILLDVGDGADAGDVAGPDLAAVALSGEPQLRLRNGILEVPRLTRLPTRPPVEPSRPLDPDGTVLITGGTGTLGSLTARHLVAEHGVRQMILAGRRGPEADGVGELTADLTRLGARVSVVAVDLADRAQVAALLAAVPAEHPLTAVVHAAGVLDDGVLTTLTPSRVDRVFGPKLDAARHLHDLTLGLDLAAFVLFSSAAGVLGNPGQGNYAAANAGLDALAGQRHRLGLPAVSFAWGYWSQASAMTRHLGPADLRRNRGVGLVGLSPAEGMALFDAGLRGAATGVLAGKFDLAAVRSDDTAISPLLRGLLRPRRPVARAGARTVSGAGSLAERIGGLTRPEQIGALVELVCRQAAEVLGHSKADAVNADRTFKEAGFDSLTALELRNRLASATGLTLSATMIFDYPRPVALAEQLRTKLLGGTSHHPAATRRRGAPADLPADEPIAIVSMACRFPAGVQSPEDLWRVVSEGIDAVTEFPADRGWDTDRLYHPDPDHPGTTYVRHGAFLDDAAGFDAAFFGISPNEALAMDPQQRLLLETSWEAFERAGIDPTSLAGQDIGVFVGVNSHDWTVRMQHAAGVEGFRLTGGSGSVISGRVAYHLGLEGAAITIDTACSSSLVALHLASQALRRGECSMALVGGVMVVGTIETFVEFSRQRGLAPDGRCKPFADAADGTGWSEGAGLLLVEPLSDARRRGHQVLAVVRGSAVNQDGASNGLTAPNGPSQQRVIRKALDVAGLRPDQVDAVEAHGTGTTLGDPIEAQALLETYGQGRAADRPLWLGSVKSNLGHTQAAAGLAGVIKMVMALRHGVLPRTLHVDRPSTHVDWAAGAVRLLSEARDWPATGQPRRAGVSSFGIGGTNAHIILEQAPDHASAAAGTGPGVSAEALPEGVADLAPVEEPVPTHESMPLLVPVSAGSPSALRAQAGRLADFLDARPDVSLAQAARALAGSRAHLNRRAVVVAHDREQVVADLRAVRSGSATVVTGTPVPGKLAFLFTGQGSQWPGMGRALATASPVFAGAFAAACQSVERHLMGHVTRPLAEVVFSTPGSDQAELLDRTMYTQAGLFALEVALFRLFASWGVHPDLVAGHSVGEITAAHVSGVLGLAEAGELVAARGRLMQALPEGGAMVAVGCTEDDVAPLLASAPGMVVVAAVNSGSSLVLSGERGAVLAVARELAGQGHKTRRLPVSHAFHSPLMVPMLADLRAVAEGLSYRPGDRPVVSTLTGRLVEDGRLGMPGHWVEQAQGTVRFGAAIAALRDQGATTFLELGPGGTLTAMALESPDLAAADCVSTLRRHGCEPVDVVTALAGLSVRGVPVDWAAVLGGAVLASAGAIAGSVANDLPTYAFQRQRYWIDDDHADADDQAGADGAGARDLRSPVMDLVDGQAEPATPSRTARIAGRPAADQRRMLLDLVRESSAVVLGHRDTGALDDQQSFRTLGFDSLSAVRLRHRLHDLTGADLPTTSVFDYPTPKALSDRLWEELFGESVPEPAAARPGPVDEPIAIVGMGVRLPGGVDSPEELWRLVEGRRDGISGFPIDRGWDLEGLYHPDPAHPGTSYTRSGGFLHDAAQFDAGLFGISPREALAMDPQQRLLLETSWEALEHAGIDPMSARGQDVGVFTGIVHHDYVTRLHRVPEDVQGYLMTGTSPSVASGRVSYVFGFEGPAVTVDTACSSSLVAMHLAAQSLRLGECSMALAGGATVMASPDAFLEFSRQRGLSADGRCKAFSAAADGTGWSEGVGVVVLERLSVARERNHRVLAVLRGSAVNQDGASNGLTAPNGPSQQRVIRRALAAAGLDPADVDLVEAHGTGTILGDPIEAQALLATYGQGRDLERPVWLGSLKSNIGHTQAAAGVAGVIKMVEALRRGVMPPTLHAEEPSTQVDWSSGALRLLTGARDWPRADGPRRAAVSAFGASGTNAHVILEEADEQPVAVVAAVEATGPAGMAGPVLPLVLSARSARSLSAQAGRLSAFVEVGPDADGGTEVSLPAVAAALVMSRARLPERAVVVAGSRPEALAGLAALARGESAPNLVLGNAVGSGAPGKTLLIFPGQGSQWAGMGRELLESSPVFRNRIEDCASALRPWVEWSLVDVLRGAAGAQMLERVDVLQPASFAVMIGLAAVWASIGVLPDAVLGHSQGEIAAACVAGALSLDDAARIVAVRSQLIATTLSGRGAMASVALGADQVRSRIEGWAGRIEVAVVNGPSSVVIGGDTEALDQAVESLTRDGVRVRRVAVDYASHTHQVEEIAEVLVLALGEIEARVPAVPFYSTVTGGWIEDGAILDGGYWYRNLRQQVGFGPAITDLRGQGYGVFLEVSAHPVLVQPISELVDAGAAGTALEPVVSGTLGRDDGGPSRLLTSAATLFVGGVPVDWSAAVGLAGGSPAPEAGPVLELPSYAFEHQHYWLGEAPGPGPDDDAGATSAVDSAFWAAIEQADLASLTGLLELSADQRDALGAVMPVLADWRQGCRRRSSVEQLRYTVSWSPLEREAVGVPSGRWLIVTPATEPDAASVDATIGDLIRGLAGHGLDLVRLEAPPTRSQLSEQLAAVLAEHEVSGVLSLLALDPRTGTGPQDPSAITASTLTLIQALATAGAGQPLWCLTRSAVNIGIRDTLAAPAQAALWGLGRAAALERLDRWGGLIDLPTDPDPRTAQHLLGILSGAGGEDQLAIRRSGVYVRRLGRKPVPGPGAGRRWTPRGTVLVTGGAEGLGRHVSLWLAQAGAERLIVTTTAQADPDDVDELRSQLSELGSGSAVESCPDSDREAISELILRVADQPVTAVVHAADLTRSSLIDDVSGSDLAEVFATKVDPAVWLSERFAGTPLDAFVVFSSIAGVWGGGGLSPSGAANAVLDALVEWRRAQGLSATSVAWGALNLAGVGLDQAALAQLRRRGVLPMDPAVAIAALVQAVEGNEQFVAVADMGWASFIPAFTSVRPSPLFADLPEAKAALRATEPDADTGDTTSSLVTSLRAVTDPEQHRILLRLVRAQASAVLGHSGADGVGPAQAFQEAGFDSLAAVNLRNNLNRVTGLRLPATLIFDYPTPEALVGHLRSELLRDAEDIAAGREDELRRVLAALPLARFRQAGVLEALLGLVDADASASAPASVAGVTSNGVEPDEDIDAMDITSLVQRALGSSA
jgi:rifamycin polyketide synthase module 1/2/3